MKGLNDLLKTLGFKKEGKHCYTKELIRIEEETEFCRLFTPLISDSKVILDLDSLRLFIIRLEDPFSTITDINLNILDSIPKLEKLDLICKEYDLYIQRYKINPLSIIYRHKNRVNVLEIDYDIILNKILINKIYPLNEINDFEEFLINKVFNLGTKSGLVFEYMFDSDPKHTIDTYTEIKKILLKEPLESINKTKIPDNYKYLLDNYEKEISDIHRSRD